MKELEEAGETRSEVEEGGSWFSSSQGTGMEKDELAVVMMMVMMMGKSGGARGLQLCYTTLETATRLPSILHTRLLSQKSLWIQVRG